jgi:hypothetical protein
MQLTRPQKQSAEAEAAKATEKRRRSDHQKRGDIFWAIFCQRMHYFIAALFEVHHYNSCTNQQLNFPKFDCEYKNGGKMCVSRNLNASINSLAQKFGMTELRVFHIVDNILSAMFSPASTNQGFEPAINAEVVLGVVFSAISSFGGSGASSLVVPPADRASCCCCCCRCCYMTSQEERERSGSGFGEEGYISCMGREREKD